AEKTQGLIRKFNSSAHFLTCNDEIYPILGGNHRGQAHFSYLRDYVYLMYRLPRFFIFSS
ncbi:hypothetical protein P0W48_14835, partial [Plesiomonas shigelloides]|uniref:hypothetical protein n=1 Tax=Plesiomonas shigelloides TaxID=703 RepID=UPI003138CC50